MKTTSNRKEYIQPQVGTAYLADNPMDQNFASWAVDDESPILIGYDNDDTPEDAKSFTFDSNWDTWEQDEIGWY